MQYSSNKIFVEKRHNQILSGDTKKKKNDLCERPICQENRYLMEFCSS